MAERVAEEREAVRSQTELLNARLETIATELDRLETERRRLEDEERRQADLAAELEGRLTAIRRLEQMMLGHSAGDLRGGDGGRRWNVDDLQRRVEAAARAYPTRLPEWNSYLLYLRAYADASGTLPPALDTLVKDVFEPLL